MAKSRTVTIELYEREPVTILNVASITDYFTRGVVLVRTTDGKEQLFKSREISGWSSD